MKLLVTNYPSATHYEWKRISKMTLCHRIISADFPSKRSNGQKLWRKLTAAGKSKSYKKHKISGNFKIYPIILPTYEELVLGELSSKGINNCFITGWLRVCHKSQIFQISNKGHLFVDTFLDTAKAVRHAFVLVISQTKCFSFYISRLDQFDHFGQRKESAPVDNCFSI